MKYIQDELFDNLLEQAAGSPRLRAHFNFHADYDEPVQRLFIGLLPGTYIRPHCHETPNKWEMLLLLQGEVVVLVFDDKGFIKQRIVLSHRETKLGLELERGSWHMLYPTHPSIIMEVKEGPYNPQTVSTFAQWAPPEGDEAVPYFLQWVYGAAAGKCWVK